MRLWSTLGALARAGHEITLITLATPKEVAEAPLDQLAAVSREIVIVCKDVEHFTGGASNYLRRLTSILASLPYSARRYLSAEMKEAVRKKLLAERFDVVFCDHVFSAVNLPECTLPILISTHNVESRILELYSQVEQNPLKALYARWESIRMKRLETRVFRRCNLGIACSSFDAEQINTLCPQLPMFVVPNVVDIEGCHGDAEDPATILYAGDMSWYPNCDALRYFVRESLPQVQKEIPKVRLVAAGRNPSSQFRAEFADVEALSFTGTLPDLRPVLRQATVAVVPLRIGSGTRLKILEFGAMGKPIVSSALGAQGLDFVPEKEILLADTPTEFAHQVIRLLRSPDLRQMLGSAARRRVQQDYCLETLDRSLANALRALTGHLTG